MIDYKEPDSDVVERFPCKIFVANKPEGDAYELEINLRGVISTNCMQEVSMSISFNQEG